MRLSNSGLVVAAAGVVNVASSVSAAVALPPGFQANAQNIVPGAYIVTFEESLPSSKTFYQNLTANGIAVSTRQTFDPAVFAGASFRLNSINDTYLDTIGNFTQVKSISPVRLHKRAAPVGEREFSLAAKRAALARRVIKEKKAASRAEGSNVTMTTHQMTGVDKLHKEGLDGAGIKIGIIDTGVDYTLAALGGGYGPGFKIAHGYDLVGDYDSAGNPAPDTDPMDCLGHGTHVAGIIGASNDPYILGVAPNASLYVYKVFACEDNAPTDVLIAAFIMAHNDGVDLITSSIGSNNGWPEDPWSAATAAIVKLGTPCMLAAGNAGEDGLFYASSAASGTDVTAIGSVDNVNTPSVTSPATYSISGTAPVEFGYVPGIGDFSGVSLPLAATTLSITFASDACTANSQSLKGKIALIRRGTCTFDTKVGNAVAAGAEYVILYNNVAGAITPSISNTDVKAVAMVTAAIGESWVTSLIAGSTIQITFQKTTVFTPGPLNNLTGGSMSYYSSYGLDAENNIKPLVSAPGGNILSTYLSSEDSYAVLSGTSMATPFIAGVVALYMQAKGKATLNPKKINNALSAAATPLRYNDRAKTYSYLSSVAQQGGGLIDAYKMVHTHILLTESSIPLNDTGHFNDKPDFYVQNTGTTTVTYTFTHLPAANAYTFDAATYGINEMLTPATIPIVDQLYASMSFNPASISIDPGQQKHIRFTITPNSGLNKTLVPVYSGFIEIKSQKGDDVVNLPYAGVAARMNNIPIIDSSLGLYSVGSPLSTTTFKGASIPIYQPSSFSLPSYYYSNTWAAKSIRLDIVSLNSTNKVYALDLKTVGSVPGYPQVYLPRILAGFATLAQWDGTLADGGVVGTGVYRLVLRAAKAFGGLERGRDYEKWESEVFFMDMS